VILAHISYSQSHTAAFHFLLPNLHLLSRVYL